MSITTAEPKKTILPILHLNTEMTCRGGEKQLLYFLDEGASQNHFYYVGVSPQSYLSEVLKNYPGLKILKSKSWFHLFSFLNLLKFIRDKKIKIIHAQTAKAHNLAFFLKLFFPYLKIFVHRRVDFLPKNNFFNHLKYSPRCVNKIFAVSLEAKKILMQFGINPKLIEVIYDSLPLEKTFSWDEKKIAITNLIKKFNLPENNILLCQAAFFYSPKGYDVLIHGLKLLKEKNSQFTCFLVGDGELKNEMEELVKKLQLEQNVIFTGHLSDIKEIITGTDIFILASRLEAFGSVLLEASMTKNALIGSSAGGIPEVIDHEVNGLIFKNEDEKDLSEKILLLIKNEKMRRNLVENHQEKMQHDFDLKKNYQKQVSLYE